MKTVILRATVMGPTGIDGLSDYARKHAGSWNESLKRQFQHIVAEENSFAMAA